MTEQIDDICPQLTVYLPKNVCIEGNKEGFNSKIAIDKFKMSVKKMDKENSKLNLEELQKKYIKPDFKLILINHDTNDKNIIINIEKIIENKVDTKKLLKEKIRSMEKNRTNLDYHKAKQNENVSDEILKLYNDLKKITKMPVPDPCEMLSHPEQYKPLLKMVLNNQMINKMGATHPYIKYFKLISDKLNFQTENTEQEQVNPTIIPNKISTSDDDTDEED
jgi:hypothetical protein